VVLKQRQQKQQWRNLTNCFCTTAPCPLQQYQQSGNRGYTINQSTQVIRFLKCLLSSPYLALFLNDTI